MNFSVGDWVGGIGLVLIELSYITQIVRVWRRREAEDVSVFFPLLNLVGRLLAAYASLRMGENVFVFGFLFGAAIRTCFLVQTLVFRSRAASVPASEKHVEPIDGPQKVLREVLT